ncbi:hypothetical protein KIL84_008331 [Mauremys mutica]|uniref:Uncharacterized protein n=1 Tax=Mauremys mutica TaxID=74926 RepID=A0A9D3X9L5_9SAUR|nr:hypothetical protein KIL84_008331 [Mauremys mutica]
MSLCQGWKKSRILVGKALPICLCVSGFLMNVLFLLAQAITLTSLKLLAAENTTNVASAFERGWQKPRSLIGERKAKPTGLEWGRARDASSLQPGQEMADSSCSQSKQRGNRALELVLKEG